MEPKHTDPMLSSRCWTPTGVENRHAPSMRIIVQVRTRNAIGYFTWRVMTGRHDVIEYHMQIPSHARCLVDNGFGHLKKLYRRSNIDSMDSLTQMVNMSSASNDAVRYPARKWRDWKGFLSRLFCPVPAIRHYQNFSKTTEEPGVVTMRTGVGCPEVKIIVAMGGVHIPYHRPQIVEAK
ncbi:hypothetical protein DPMN_056533 [Dreissena polymorpha]|uniref:Uncharacterized protein n=1 Tax=Dreissena polymorpha TaxID=45954 RepID=A0A9D4HV52_DREPO|nr:hypothetical protein DPMN_056533 [Dreissena polymorpha]